MSTLPGVTLPQGHAPPGRGTRLVGGAHLVKQAPRQNLEGMALLLTHGSPKTGSPGLHSSSE